MTLPGFSLRPGQSIFDQVVFAAIRAFVSGEYRPGQAFPSVRVLAADLKINPNTAHKVVQHLIQERWLEVRPGIGTFVASPPEARSADRAKLLNEKVEQLVVEAMRLGLSRSELLESIEVGWNKLEDKQESDRR
jgi:DNA-binding transcriptional regulator YhcF (GntR family)